MVTEPGSMSEPGSITEGSAAAADSPTEAERWVWHPIATGVEASLRGLAIGPDGVVWASGAHGTVLAATGEDVVNVSVPGVDDDLRSLAVLDARTVLVVSAGRPARFFRTSDAGATWSETHSDDREGIFVDALAFRDAREGLAVGDPLPGDEGPCFVVFRTHDGGVTWGSSLGPLALEGEAAFAASNGALVLLPPRGAAFVTGGAGARVHWTDDVDAARWTSRAIPGHDQRRLAASSPSCRSALHSSRWVVTTPTTPRPASS